MTLESESNDLTNTVFAGYRILHRLGRGGMADVYLGFHETLLRHCAIKVLRQDLVRSPDHLQRFLQEARAAASLVHPNIVQVYDIGQFEGKHYIAQEYIAGSNLRAYVQRVGPLPLNEAMSILIQTAQALQKASSAGIVHRDIKPENILLTPDGEVKVADFGLARAHNQDINLTEVGVTLGTPLYMSPEQIQGMPVDARSDLYSLGVTAFQILSGRTPFEGETPLSLAVQHLQNEPPKLQELRTDLPNNLCDIVQHLLAKKPDERISTARELVILLKGVAEGLPGDWHANHQLPLVNLIVEKDADIAAQTMRLQTATLRARDQGRRWRKFQMVGYATLIVLAATAFGFASQYGRQELLPKSRDNIDVKKQDSIMRQYFEALIADRLELWQAVEKYYKPDEDPANFQYNVKAWLQLARCAIRQSDDKRDYEPAIRALNKLLSHPEVENKYKVLANLEMITIHLDRNELAQVERTYKDTIVLFNSLNDEQKTFVHTYAPANRKKYLSKDDTSPN